MRFGRRCLAAAAAAAAGASAPARRTTFAPRFCPLSRSHPFSPLSQPTRSLSPFVTGALRLPLSHQPTAAWSLAPSSCFLLLLFLFPSISVSAARSLASSSSYRHCRGASPFVRGGKLCHARHASSGPSHRLLSPTPTPRRILPATATATTTIRR